HLAAKGFLIAFVAGARSRLGTTIGEVIGAGDAVLQMIKCAVKSEPVVIFGLHVKRMLVVKLVDPAGKCLVLGDAAKRGLPQMAVRGEQSGDDPLAMRIPGFFRDKARGGRA